jgi:hypothetical protein
MEPSYLSRPIYYPTYSYASLAPFAGSINFFWFNLWGFNSPPRGAVQTWGYGGFVPPTRRYFKGEIFNIPELVPGIIYSQWGLIPKNPLTRGSFRTKRFITFLFSS